MPPYLRKVRNQISNYFESLRLIIAILLTGRALSFIHKVSSSICNQASMVVIAHPRHEYIYEGNEFKQRIQQSLETSSEITILNL